MAKYAAFLRGIGPGNPNMRNDKLRGVFESLGLKNVQSVISSGNILFESDETNIKKFEAMVEKEWPKQLGFQSTTIIRSQQDLEKLTKLNPFGDLKHGPGSYLLVTFFQKPTKVNFKLPYSPSGKTYKLIWADKDTLCTVTDNTVVKTTDLMSWLEKQFGKEISSRTWKTVEKIHQKLGPLH